MPLHLNRTATAMTLVVQLFGATSVSAASDLQALWRLDQIDGTPVAAMVTLDLTEQGRIAGQGPCNRYSGENQAALPALRVAALISTKMACPDLTLETVYFTALTAATAATLGKDDLLVVTGDGAGSLIFVRTPE